MKIKLDYWTTIIKIIGEQKETFVLNIARLSNITYPHIAKIIIELEDKQFITKIKDGRKYKITLTLKGKKLYNILLELDKILK